MKAVYCITNLVTGVKYCGSAIDFDRRKKQHLTMFKNGTHINKWMQADYDKYGAENMVFSILHNCSNLKEPLVKDMEQAFINTGKFKYNVAKYTSKRNSEGRLSSSLTKNKKKKMSMKYKDTRGMYI